MTPVPVHSRRFPPGRLATLVLCAAGLLSACSTVQEQAQGLARQGRHADALALLDQAARQPNPPAALQAERRRLLQDAVYPWLAQAEWARAGGRTAEARAHLARATQLDPDNPRAQALLAEIERSERHEATLAAAQDAVRNGRTAAARQQLEALLREAPRHSGARALLRQLAAPVAEVPLPPQLAEAYRRPVTLEFGNMPLRNVFEALQRSHGLNFVFDRDVRTDSRVSLMLRDVPLDEALRVVLVTQQLERKVLNGNTLLVYPATAAKQREHQELVTRTLYLTNTDAKTAAATVRGVAKTQDLLVDERLNALIVRDAPAVVRQIEDLLLTLDLPDPEVMIEVEVLEVSSSKLLDLGLQWPEEVSLGVFGSNASAAANVVLSRDLTLRGRVANPLMLATLRGTTGVTNTLANPTIRARNREKAQVQVGEKLPVFSSTPASANVAGSTTVTYLDVGIKLDVEPTVQLDNEVVIKVALEASNLVRAVQGPAGSVAYQVGTRRTSTTLRLRDGETQILAGLTKDDDLRGISGLPGLSALPLLGPLFGLHTDQRNKTEVVLLMTPRILRNLPLPEPEQLQRPGGTLQNPGAEGLRLSPQARAIVRPSSGAPVPGEPASAAAAAPAATALELRTSGSGAVGEVVTVTVANPTEWRVRGELGFEPTLLRNAAAGEDNARSLPFDLPPGGSRVLALRVLPAAAGQGLEVTATVAAASTADGAAVATLPEVRGSGRIEVRGAR